MASWDPEQLKWDATRKRDCKALSGAGRAAPEPASP